MPNDDRVEARQMTRRMMLPGEVEYIEDRGPDQVEQLRSEIQSLARIVSNDINDIRDRVMRIEQGLAHAAGGNGNGSSPVALSDDRSAKWSQIKNRLQPRLRDAIDVLLLQGPMSGTQLAAAMRMDRSNCSKNVVAILLRQGLIVRDGHNLSLKQI